MYLPVNDPVRPPLFGYMTAPLYRGLSYNLAYRRARYVIPPNNWNVDDRLLPVAATNIPTRRPQTGGRIIITQPMYNFGELLR